MMHARSHSASTSSSSSSICEGVYRPRPIQSHPKNIAVVGRGREALALSPNTAEAFTQNLNALAVCSSPELNIPSNYPPPNPNPGPILRRVVSEAPHKPSGSGLRTSKLPPVSTRKGLPPPPRQRRRPPPLTYVSTLGAPLAQAEQGYSPFVVPESPRRSASVPPSAVSSAFWGCAGSSSSSSEGEDADLDAIWDDYDFTEPVKSALGGTYFPPTLNGGRYNPSPPSSPRLRRIRSKSPEAVRRPLRVQVSVERVAFRDETMYQPPRHHTGRSSDELMRNMGAVGVAQGLPGLEDGIKTREMHQECEAVHALGGQRAAKVSIGKALGKLWKRCT